jgi:hypothetical protein
MHHVSTYLRYLPTPLLVIYAITIVVWLTTIVMALYALWLCAIGSVSAIRRAVMIAAIAAAISVLGAAPIFPVTYNYTSTITYTSRGREPVVHTSGWNINSRWFFAPVAGLSILALAVSIAARSRVLAPKNAQP